MELIKATAAFLLAMIFLAIAVGMHREIFAAPTKPVESAELVIEVSALVVAFVLIYIAITAVADYRIAYRLVGV